MRIIAKSTLRKFWEQPHRADAKGQLNEWYHYVAKAAWKTPHEVKKALRNASILKSSRVVFNVAGNKYRLVAAIDYQRQIVWIKFIGTHKQYDSIDAENI